MGTKTVKKLLSLWWARIFIYSMLCSLFFTGLFLIPESLNLPPTFYIFLSAASFLLPGLLIERFRAEGKAFTLGFRIDLKLFKEFLISLVMCIIIFGCIITIGLAFGAKFYFNPDWNGFTGYIWNTIILLLFYALTEELIFRGLVFQTLSQRFNPVIVTLISALAFSIAHSFNNWVSLTAYINIFLAGILFSVMYLRTLSLWLPFFFHFFWNLFQSLFLGLPVSGFDFGISMTKLDLSDTNPLLTSLISGNFGIEGGIFTSIAMLSLLIYTIIYLNPSPFLQSVIFKRKFAESFLISNKKMVA